MQLYQIIFILFIISKSIQEDCSKIKPTKASDVFYQYQIKYYIINVAMKNSAVALNVMYMGILIGIIKNIKKN